MVRSDLACGPQAAQGSHAAFQFAFEHPEICREWYEKSNYLIMLSVPDEDALLDYADMAHFENVPYSLFHEPDLDGSDGGWHTALAIAPSHLGAKLSHLPLLGKEVAIA